MPHRIRTCNLVWLAALVITLTRAIPTHGAISSGPNLTNTTAAEQQRILLFHEAEQSYQEKLRVGRERYNQKQTNRAKVIAAMSSELQARQRTVMIQPMRPLDDAIEIPIVLRYSPFVAALAVGLVGFGARLNRLREESLRLPKLPHVFFPVHAPEPEPAMVPLAEAVFFCKDSGADGCGRSTEEGFVVLKGSVGRKENDPASIGSSVTAFRTKMLDAGVIREEGDTIIFERDQLFATPSMAANTLLGKKTNGWTEWKTKDGIPLDTVQRLQPKEQL
jgi:hypothetical protein